MNVNVITPDEVATLNAARTVLRDIASRNFDKTVHGTAILTEHAVFSVLNQANAYCGAGLTDAELHNHETADAA